MGETGASPHVRILLAARNGAVHLEAQLDSLRRQEHADWSLDIGDDGSTDATGEIARRFAARIGNRRVRLSDGPRQGAAANFLSLLRTAVADAGGACIAFCDQDDVWLPGKLARAVEWIGAHEEPEAGICYVCRTRLAGPDLRPQGLSRLHPRGPSFGNALVQNILGGNTIVLSPAAAAVVAASVPAAVEAGVPYHDWWVYLLTSGAGTMMLSDPDPFVLYRQHRGNLLGHHGPVRGRLNRIGMVARRQYSGWIDANLAGLAACAELLTPVSHGAMQQFAEARRAGGPALIETLRTLNIHRQTPNGDRMLGIIARTGRL